MNDDNSTLQDIIHGYVLGVIVGVCLVLYWWITHR